MNSKKWCVIAFFAVLSAVIAIVILNIKEDPFGAFGDDWYSYNETKNPRVAKVTYLKKNHDKYDSYIIGCSSTSSYPVEDLNRYMDADFYNMIMYGADMHDVEETVYYLAENYTVNNLVLNVYIDNGFEYDFEPDRITGSMHADVSKTSKLKFYAKYAFVNPRYSFDKISSRAKDGYLPDVFDVFCEETGAYDKRKRDAEHISDLEDYYEKYPAFADYPFSEHTLTKITETSESIGRIKQFCDDKGIRLIVMNAPVYCDYFKGISSEDVKSFYKAIADKVDFWDFSISSVSTEPRYFYDETHFRNDVGSMALARIFGDSSIYIPEDFGFLVTKENAQEYVESIYEKEYAADGHTKKLPILMYHDIGENDGSDDVVVSPEAFERHIKLISENGFAAVTLEDVLNYIKKGVDLPEKAVLITFDDGYMSNYIYGFPILKKYGQHAVIFAVGETFGKDKYPGTDKDICHHFGMAELKEMEASGFIEVQSHTYGMHEAAEFAAPPIYEDILKKDDESDLDYVKRVRKDISLWEETLNKKMTALAFPHGMSDILSQAVLNENGVKLTFSTNAKTDTLIKGLRLSGYNLGRYTITERTTDSELLDILESGK